MAAITVVYCILTTLFIVVAVASLIDEKRARISPTPTLPAVSRAALKLVALYTHPAKIGHVAELGCGWGGMLLALARAFPHSILTGYELAFWPRLTSRLRTYTRRRRIRVTRRNFFTDDLARFDLVYCYLSPWHMAELKPKLEATRPGTVIVSNAFAIPGWTPAAVEYVEGLVRIPVFVYVRGEET
jgi:hypothetical protein